jgi:hypothetical protein
MNANHHPRTHASRLLFAVVLAVLALLSGLVTPGHAQVASGPLLATQFFDAIASDSSSYMVGADAVLHTPVGDFHGRSGLTDFGDELEASFSGITFATQSAAQISNLVIVSFTFTGINTGSYQGLPPNCAGVAVPGVAVLRIEEQVVSGDSWEAGQLGQHLDGSEMIRAIVVTEQWIDYDADMLASQIASFNEFDPSTRPGCADHWTDDELPPVVPGPNEGDLPY